MSLVKEFKEFALKGNMIDLAVAVIMGGAFGKVVASLVNNLFMPCLGVLTSGIDFKNLSYELKPAVMDGDKIKIDAQVLHYGEFLSDIVTFLVVALAIFLLVNKVMGAMKKKEPDGAPTTKDCPACCMTIPIKASKCAHCTSAV